NKARAAVSEDLVPILLDLYPGSWSENILEYFLRSNQITAEDGAQITWYHAANHKAQVNEALKNEHRAGSQAFPVKFPLSLQQQRSMKARHQRAGAQLEVIWSHKENSSKSHVLL
uniref:Family with sequence similarity 151 member B n=1 Tax=Equus caballus TaxID=9796 RepID=A0A5F5PVS2_HORSE